MFMYRLEVIAEFSKDWKNYFNSPPLAQFCTQTNQSATKSVWEVQAAYCPKFILDSTGNALEKDKLIQETQQKKSAAFSHSQVAPPDFTGSSSPRLNWLHRNEQGLSHKGVQTTVFTTCPGTLSLDRTQTLFSSQTTGSLHTSDSDGFSFSRNFSKWKLPITLDAVSPLHLINKNHQESPQYWDAQSY